MRLTPTCCRCGAVQSHANPIQTISRLIGGLALEPRSFCVDEATCMARRFALPRTVTEAHRVVVANRKAARQ